MLRNFQQCCVIDSQLTNNFHLVKEVNVSDNWKYLQDVKNVKLFSWEEGLLEIIPNWHTVSQLDMTKNVL